MPLRDLADALTRVGIAVLRVDDRGIGKSTWLRSHPGIDPKRDSRQGVSSLKSKRKSGHSRSKFRPMHAVCTSNSQLVMWSLASAIWRSTYGSEPTSWFMRSICC
jgi:hypothetical protein